MLIYSHPYYDNPDGACRVCKRPAGEHAAVPGTVSPDGWECTGIVNGFVTSRKKIGTFKVFEPFDEVVHDSETASRWTKVALPATEVPLYIESHAPGWATLGAHVTGTVLDDYHGSEYFGVPIGGNTRTFKGGEPYVVNFHPRSYGLPGDGTVFNRTEPTGYMIDLEYLVDGGENHHVEVDGIRPH